VFSHTPTANTTFAFSNPPASGTASSATLKLTGANVGSGYDIANASYDSVSFSVATQATGPFGMDFKPDGTMFFICDLTTDTIYKYNLSTAWDLSTASYASVSKLVGSPGPVVSPFSVRFKPDGTKMYISDVSSPSTIYEWDLSTAWDITTASYNSVSLNVSSQDNSPLGIFFNNDGTKMYVVGLGTDTIYQYDFTTAWDLSTASYASKSLSVLSQDTTPRSGYLSTSGTTLFVLGAANDTIYKYTLSTADDISTASYDSVSFSVTSQENNPSDFIFKSDGTKMYVVGGTNDTVYQYTTGSSALATITYPSSVIWSGGTTPTAPANGETDVYTFYTDDGGTTYYGFQTGDALA
jgi:sugar lactone lactonase YvrE